MTKTEIITRAKKAIHDALPEDEHDHIPDWCYDTIVGVALEGETPSPERDAIEAAVLAYARNEFLGPNGVQPVPSLSDVMALIDAYRSAIRAPLEREIERLKAEVER